MSALESIVGRRVPRAAARPADIEAAKIEWWRREAGVAVRLDEIRDDWLREALAQFARKRFGLRSAR